MQKNWNSYEHRGENNSTWQDIKDAVRDAWDGITGDDDTRARAGGARSTY